MSSRIVGAVISIKRSRHFSDSTPNSAEESETYSPTLRQLSHPEKKTSQDLWFDHLLRRKQQLPMTSAALDEFAAVQTREGPHHRCIESMKVY